MLMMTRAAPSCDEEAIRSEDLYGVVGLQARRRLAVALHGRQCKPRCFIARIFHCQAAQPRAGGQRGAQLAEVWGGPLLPGGHNGGVAAALED
eukprot:7983494-Pyramimonas_sp.AAC.1